MPCPVGDSEQLVEGAAGTARHTPRPSETLAQMHEFFETYREHAQLTPRQLKARIERAEAELAERGTYTHTSDELRVGAQIAWFNHTRCIGKMYWRSLAVRDRRHVTTAEEIRDACFDHLRWAENGGRVRPLITVFAPDTPELAGPRVYNKQLVAYAGHRLEDGSWLGDAATIPLTELAERLGWSPADRGHFDVLPLLIQASDGELSAHPLPAELAGDLAIEHPAFPALSDLALRWYRFPTVSDVTLSVGGVTYPFAPFSGWYVAPELSARDFTDPDRYDRLSAIATAFGFDPGESDSLWKDRTMIELTDAVLWSYARAGVRMDSHHRACERFHKYVGSQRRRGVETSAEWAWIIPPISAAATPVYRDTYTPVEAWPNFVRKPPADLPGA
jgi:nitric-oxide synthase